MTEISILILAIAGLIITSRIYISKKEKLHKKTMFCPLDSDCEIVLFSKHNRFGGVLLEYTGLVYYSFIFLAYSAFIINPELQYGLFGFLAAYSTLFGFLFSLYLTFIQWKVVKSWCTWCLYLTMASVSIFFTSFFHFTKKVSLEEIVNQYYALFSLADILVITFATGAVIVAEVLTFKFLKDFHMNEQESSVLLALWQIIWIFIFSAVILTMILMASTETEVSLAEFREVKILIIVLLSIISSFWFLPRIHKASQNMRMNVWKIANYRILVVTIGSILISNWLLISNDSLNLFLYTTIALIFISNLSLFLTDHKKSKDSLKS